MWLDRNWIYLVNWIKLGDCFDRQLTIIQQLITMFCCLDKTRVNWWVGLPSWQQRSGDKVHDETENILGEMLRSVERLQELLEEVLDQSSLEKMNQAQEVADNLEAEIRERRKRDTEMKDLADCGDNIYYLQV